MVWNDNASMYDEHLENYRHELDKHSTNLRKIFDEIKKDDSIDINTANMIEGAIRQIKSSRKRWASGVNSPAENVSGLNLQFKPIILIYYAKGYGYHSELGSNTTCDKLIFISNNTVTSFFHYKAGYSSATRFTFRTTNIENAAEIENFKNYPGLGNYVSRHNIESWIAFD